MLFRSVTLGTSARFHYDIGSAVTSVTGNDAAGNTLAYDAGFIDVYVNGVRMSTADVTVTSGDTVTFASALASGDEVDIVAFGTFAVANIVSTGALNSGSITSGFGTINNGASAITTTGVGSFGSLDISGNIDVDGTTNLDVVDIDGAVNMATTLLVAGETTLQTHLNMGDGDIIKLGDSGDLEIFHDGSNSNVKDTGTGSLNLIASTKVQVQGVNGETMAIFNEDGSAELRHNDAKKFETTSSGVTVTGGVTTTTASSIEGGVVFNEASADVDFRVESNGNANMLVVNGGTDSVQIGTNIDLITGAAVLTVNGQTEIATAAGTQCLDMVRGDAGLLQNFRKQGGSSVGNITISASATAFNTSSDYRLKENVVTSWDATTRLKQLKPSRFNFIADADTTVDGFLAHEVSSIVPEAVTGTKDATEDITNVVLNADGTIYRQAVSEEKWIEGKSDGTYASDTTWVANKTIPDHQSIDQSKLVPLLTKALQEQQATIEALTARIVTLENA